MEEKKQFFHHECSYKQDIYSVDFYPQRVYLELTYTNMWMQKIFHYQLGGQQIANVLMWANSQTIQDVIESYSCFTYYSLHIDEECNDLYFKKKYLTSASSQIPIEMVPLNIQESLALSAFRIIKQCLEVTSEYIYANIAHGSIRQYLLKKNFIQESQILIKTFFEVIQGPHIPQRKNVYDSERFSTACIDQTIYFNPTRRTLQLIKAIFKKTKTGSLFIIGRGGVGKSFSLAFLCDLSKIIEEFKIKNTFHPKKAEGILTMLRMAGHTSLFTNQISFPDIPKIFYVNFRPDFSQQTIIHKIIEQIPQKILQNFKETTKFPDLIRKIKQYYSPYSIQLMFILDQFNVYTSQIRKYFEGQINTAQNIKSMTRFIRSVQDINIKVVFCSSINFQKDILCSESPYVENIFHNRKATMQYALQSEDNENNCAAIEVIHTIFFELEMRIYAVKPRKVGTQMVVELKRRKEKLLESQYLRDIYSNNINASDLCILTHDTISQYFRQSQILDIKFMFCGQDQIEKQFCGLKDDIQSYYFSSLRKHFQQHINRTKSEEQNFTKMEIIIYLRAEARRFLKEEESSGQLLSSFSLTFNEQTFERYGNFDLIDKMHALVQRQRIKITIFLDPSIFLIATNHIYLVTGASKFFKQFINKLKSAQTGAFENYMEDTVVKILAQSDQSRQARLIMSKQYRIIKGNYTFVHFEPNKNDLDVISNFRQLTKTAKEKSIKPPNFICAYPIRKPKGKKKVKKEIRSYNSWIIDILLLNWINQQSYNIITIDLTITKRVSILKYKIEMAVDFFKKTYGGLSPNDVYHKIVAPTSTLIEYFHLENKRQELKFDNLLQIYLNKFKDQTKENCKVEIQLFPIENFKVDFFNSTEDWQEKTEYLYIWKVLEEERQEYMIKP